MKGVVFKDMHAKILRLCKHVGITKDQFIPDIVDKQSLRPSVVKHWFDKANVKLRSGGPKSFMAYWHSCNVPLDLTDFSSTLDEFEEKLATFVRPDAGQVTRTLPASAPKEISTEPRPVDLVGCYQVIRPHAVYEKTYVLEAMQIEYDGKDFCHLFFSHHRIDQSYLYEGKGYAERRYYFALMSRLHEEFDGLQSHRCVSFYIDEPRYKACISGVMLRGVAGKAGKEAVGLPFIAMPTKTSGSLRRIDPVMVTSSEGDDPEQLCKIHADGHLLVGEVRESSYPALFDVCHNIFNDDGFVTATRKTKPMVIWTVPPGTLKNIKVIRDKVWCATVDKLFPAPQPEGLAPKA